MFSQMFTKYSFKAQITWLSTSLILVTVALLTASFGFKVARYIDNQIENQMYFAENVIRQNLSSQEKVLITAARVLAADFGFKQAVATRDKNTINSVLNNHGKRINADLMVLLDTEGRVITSGSFQSFSDKVLEQNINLLPLKGVHGQVVNIQNKVFQIIVVPVKAPRLIAYSIIGFEFDHQALLELKELASVDVTFVKNKQIISSTFTEPTTVEGLLTSKQARTEKLLFTSVDFFHKQVALGDSFKVSAILSASLVAIHNDFIQLISSILIISILVIVIAVALSKLLHRGVTIPLNLLSNLTKKISAGNLSVPKLKDEMPTEFFELYQGFSVMGTAIEHREQEIKYQAERDLLTGLYNRHTMHRVIADYLEKHIELVLITFNIKGFKVLNDTIGVANGDAILKEIARRTTRYIDSITVTPPLEVIAARVNSDEFMIAIPITQSDEIENYIELLQDELDRQFWLDDIRLNLSLYFGVANSIEHSADGERLMRRATMAAVSAFKEQKVLRFYQQGEDEQYLYKLKLIEELKAALESEQSPMFMNYQPKLNLQTGKVDKLEALIRWVNKDGEFVNPELFVSLAENAGLIVPLTRWVIAQVLKQIAQWQEQGYFFNVSINLSAQDIQHEGFIEYLIEQISRFNVNSEQVTLELTERDLADNEELVAARLTHLKSIGFKVSVDDYGIGQSSLAKLKNLPVDELKIDKCFILTLDQCEQDQDIVASTISLGHKLGLNVVAEGVENLASLDLLRQFNCDYAQGYYLSKPITAEQLVIWYQEYDSPV
ncbi:EAL domain-containing protein [Thalassotalea sp. G2M2-11]|uniref:bifunctional diguanylate cyclase/phosphodiesterase n=1 Tax=Thalassotalea sp. G2M2-11 TaxID=2787627 RepID=UPI001F49B575|nr:EAL domain-containing protein [Thalassotalea sp. G2M2-11]